MKKHFLILIVFVSLTGLIQAQNFYTRLGIGVAGGISSNLDLLYSYSNTGSSQTITAVPLGLGRGFTGVAAFGFNASKFISLEFGISQFIGLPKIADSVMKLPGGSAFEAKVKGNMLSLLPAIVLHPGFEILDPYARIGFILGIRPAINAIAKASNASTNPPEETEAIRHYYGGVAAGLNAAMGVTWKATSVVSLYAELGFSSINYSPKKSEVVFYEENSVDMLSTLTVKQTQTEYYGQINPDEVIPDTSPDKELRKSLPFSNAGMSFGILFNF